MPSRRKFLKKSSVASIGMAGLDVLNPFVNDIFSPLTLMNSNETTENLIGLYGPWAVSLIESKLPSLSFRRNEWTNLAQWREMAKQRLVERLGVPDIGGMPQVTLKKQYEYDGLHIEELTWQLPYGRPTEGILLKPANAKGPLPAILAFHDHGGNKYFGTRKITKTSNQQHPLMKEHQQEYYEGMAWANEIAKRGYVVLVSDAFPFASRRVWMQDVPAHLRRGLNDNDPENSENIRKYNEWAGEHEHVMSKSLLSAGTTWAGVFYAEDKKALDVLCARQDVDATRVGCAGLSGGGMRTVFMGGLDERIKCAVCVGFMTTWKDLILHKSYTHTWMTYVPILPNELDFPEIFALRAPLPTMVLNDEDDDLYTLPEMKHADKIVGDVYAKAGASERYKCSFYPGPHKFDKKMQAEAFAWFDKWLK
ncbi:dienelactone hydrolase [Runella defluvii]|uniref:Dienelactone hydrolase n=1 Tax=Runella defluvii TaxID=370973 RepID=A0A7W5ZJS7_9BACT|nr:alpha/beta hydrolase family protein [Runella defluvii]MBB3837154.1 dienelactone hydrolase [Runella defluvii]